VNDAKWHATWKFVAARVSLSLFISVRAFSLLMFELFNDFLVSFSFLHSFFCVSMEWRKKFSHQKKFYRKIGSKQKENSKFYEYSYLALAMKFSFSIKSRVSRPHSSGWRENVSPLFSRNQRRAEGGIALHV
jgi:hypothetical protein